jgi:hypothetical protein
LWNYISRDHALHILVEAEVGQLVR